MTCLEGNVTKHDQAGPPPEAIRHRLPDSRDSITHKFRVGGRSGYFTVGLYPNGQPGEIFVTWNKAGSCERGLLDAWATMVSIALQSGISLEAVVSKFKHWKFEPRGMTDHEKIRMCDSTLDYICKWLELKFMPCECEEPCECHDGEDTGLTDG